MPEDRILNQIFPLSLPQTVHGQSTQQTEDVNASITTCIIFDDELSALVWVIINSCVHTKQINWTLASSVLRSVPESQV